MDKKIVKEIIPECARKFSFGKYRYHIFNKPDLVFSDNHKMELFEFTAKLIQETFEKEDQSYFRSRKNYFGDIDQCWLVLDRGGEAVGFCGVKKLC